MVVDVFDFDGTIYDGDSTFDFILFAMRRHPSLLWMVFPAAWNGFLLLLKRIRLTQFKSTLFSFMARHIPLEEEARLFWGEKKTQNKIGKWFLNRKKFHPIIIASASPDFEISPAAKMLEADLLICTVCDPKTGRIQGQNCKSDEKIKRLREQLGDDVRVEEMYTDNARADGPLLRMAERGFIVKHGQVSQWNGGK